MIIFDSMTITKSDRLKNLPWTIELRDLNVLVGPNGCGKTTIMGGLSDMTKKCEFDRKFHTNVAYAVHEEIKPPIQMYKLFYKDLVSPKRDFGEYEDSLLGIYDVQNSWVSAGQRSFTQINDIKKIENAIIFIDEMDASLDWKTQEKYFRILKNLSKKNQVFVATHSLVFCAMAKEMYDVSQRKWTTYSELKQTYFGKVKI